MSVTVFLKLAVPVLEHASFRAFSTQCRRISSNLTSLPSHPEASSHLSPLLLFFEQLKELALREVCWAALRLYASPDNSRSQSLWRRRDARPAQTKEGKDKVRESTVSLHQQRDERCLWSTHHIWCRQHHSPVWNVEGRCVCVRVCPRLPPPNNWFRSPPQHCLVVASREIKQER